MKEGIRGFASVSGTFGPVDPIHLGNPGYNEAEYQLHRLFGACVRYPRPATNISSRINGTDGLIGVVLPIVDKLKFPKALDNAIKLTLTADGFPQFRVLGWHR